MKTATEYLEAIETVPSAASDTELAPDSGSRPGSIPRPPLLPRECIQTRPATPMAMYPRQGLIEATRYHYAQPGRYSYVDAILNALLCDDLYIS
jgi:hypothetical protein